MFFIVLLVFFGLLFLVAELVLLPGVSIGAILALVSYGGAIYIAFRDYGPLAESSSPWFSSFRSWRLSFRCDPKPGAVSL